MIRQSALGCLLLLGLMTSVLAAEDPTKVLKVEKNAEKLVVEFRGRVHRQIQELREAGRPFGLALPTITKEIEALVKKKPMVLFFTAKQVKPERKWNLIFHWLLKRKPKEAELKNMVKHHEKTKDRERFFGDLIWALANTKEFLFRK